MPPFEYAGRYFSTTSKWVSKSADLQDYRWTWSFEPIADEWLQEIQGPVVDALRAKAPVGKHYDLSGGEHPTHAFQMSLYPVQYHSVGSVMLQVKSNQNYAKYILGGTRAHIIRAKGLHAGTGQQSGGASVLAFWWAKLGQAAFFPQVQHPGTKANLFNVVVKDALAPDLREQLVTKIRARYTG
jgi:hypothetical protein